MNKFDQQLDSITQNINQIWDQELIPLLCEYIKIPNKSPAFDPDWEKHGYMQQAIELIYNWCKAQPIKDMQCEIVQLPERTPIIFMEIPGQIDETVLLYGHMDKQPEMTGWDKDKGPWKPVIIDDKLYGRGGADDGYSTFASLTAIHELQKNNIPHSRCVVIIEGCEESGSYDLPFYLDKLKDRIGEPNFVICLDSGAGNYEQMWSTTSLRGLVSGNLTIEVTREGIHSGFGSGVVPSVEMVLRQLLDRIEDKHTGEILIEEFKCKIPELRLQQTKQAAEILKDDFVKSYPFADQTQPVASDVTELMQNRTWRAQLSLTGIEGYPAMQDAGNVTLPKATFKLSIRLPPLVKSSKLRDLLKEILERDPPFNANVSFDATERGTGWHAPELAPWLSSASDVASNQFFNQPTAYMGEGGMIPFMGMLGKKFPKAQFLITGVLGPFSNAHGQNEFLHIPTVKKITGCVASVLAAHYEHYKK